MRRAASEQPLGISECAVKAKLARSALTQQQQGESPIPRPYWAQAQQSPCSVSGCLVRRLSNAAKCSGCMCKAVWCKQAPTTSVKAYLHLPRIADTLPFVCSNAAVQGSMCGKILSVCAGH